MAVRGRKPKPAALKKLHGNPGKRALPKQIPAPTPADVAPLKKKPAVRGKKAAPVVRALSMVAPEFLSPVGQAEWDRVSRELLAIGLLTHIDLAALAAYCAAYSRWENAEQKLKWMNGDELSETPNGFKQQNAYIGIANRSLELMHKFMTEFGMTPVSRMRLGHQRPPADGNGATDGKQPAPGSYDAFLAQDPDAPAVH